MKHPKAYPDMANPREVRSYLHNTYDRYVHGIDLFPRARVKNPEGSPPKSRDIAQTLFKAWEIIDDDKAYFEGTILALKDNLGTSDTTKWGHVVTRVGLNAVKFAYIEVGGDQPGQLIHGTQDIKTFMEETEGEVLQLADGRQLGSYDSSGEFKLRTSPDMVMTRASGQEGLMFMANATDELTRLNEILGESSGQSE